MKTLKQFPLVLLILLGMVNRVNAQAVRFKIVDHAPAIAASIKSGSDTIEIFEPLQIHYIKIGKEVYRIVQHDPTIEKVIVVDTTTINYWPNGWRLAEPGPSPKFIQPLTQ